MPSAPKPLDEVRGSTDDLALLPEMVGAFVPYAHAVRGVGGADTAASLAVIEELSIRFRPRDGHERAGRHG